MLFCSVSLLTSSQSQSLLSELLLGQFTLSLFLGLGDVAVTGSEEQFNVAVGGLEGVDSTMGSVGSSSALLSLLDGDMGDNEVIQVQVLGSGGSLGVSQNVQNKSAGLLGPLSEGGLPLLSLGRSADTGEVSSEGDALLVLKDIFQEGSSLGDGHTLDGGSGLEGVLVVNSQVITSGLDGVF